MHEMPTIVIDDRGVSLSETLSVCHAAQLGIIVQKRLNGSRSCLGQTLLEAKETCYTGGPDPPQRKGMRSLEKL